MVSLALKPHKLIYFPFQKQKKFTTETITNEGEREGRKYEKYCMLDRRVC